jgi:hypothetical protein
MAEIPDMLAINAVGRSNAVPAGRLRTLREVNEQNREFWLQQAGVIEKWMSDEAVFSSAMNDLQAQELLGTPLRLQKSLEKALADADERIHGAKRLFKRVRTDLARKGGAATKTDALQRLILEIVRKNRDITAPQLLAWLERHKAGTAISDIDDQSEVAAGEVRRIHFADRGKDKSAPISGLKDRLSSAKKKIAAEKKIDSR